MATKERLQECHRLHHPEIRGNDGTKCGIKHRKLGVKKSRVSFDYNSTDFPIIDLT